MKSFENVYKTSKQRKLNEQQQAFAADRARLIAVMKKEYGISDFNKLSESEKANYKSLINEMWNNESGLNENGIRFINEGCAPLTQKSSDEQIEKWFKRELKADVDNVISCLITNKTCNTIVDIKKCIEESIGRKIKSTDIKKWTYEIVCKYLGTQIKSIKF